MADRVLSIFSDGSIKQPKLFRITTAGQMPASGVIPATCRVYIDQTLQISGAFTLPANWDAFIKSQNSPVAYQYLTGLQGGWSNTHPYPTVERISFRGNTFMGEYVSDSVVKMYCYKFSDTPHRNRYYQPLWWNINSHAILSAGKTYQDQAKIIVISETGYVYIWANRVEEL